MTELRQSAQEGWTDLATESSYFLKKRGGRHSSPRMLCGPKLGALREVSCPLLGRYGDGVRTQSPERWEEAGSIRALGRSGHHV